MDEDERKQLEDWVIEQMRTSEVTRRKLAEARRTQETSYLLEIFELACAALGFVLDIVGSAWDWFTGLFQ